MRILTALGAVLAVVFWLILREPSSDRAPAVEPTASAATRAPASATTSARGVGTGVVARAATAAPPSPSLPRAKGMRAQFREGIASLDPAIARCLAVANERFTGVAVLDFVAGVEPSSGLAVVETTGIVDDGTTIDSEPVLACLHETARGLAPLALPEGNESIYAAWRIELVDGEVTARRVTEYALRKPTDGPFD